MGVLEWLRAIFGSIFVLFVPGFAWSWIFFKKGKIDWIERIPLSVGMSIAFVVLTILCLNYVFHVKITLLHTVLTICALSILPVIYMSGIWYYHKRRGHNPQSQSEKTASDDVDIPDNQD
jgi:uncharacterized membrane protein